MTDQQSDASAPYRFAVAEAAFYIVAILQTVSSFAIANGDVPPGLTPSDTTMQRATTALTAGGNILTFAFAYVIVVRCLKRCADLFWRIRMTLLMKSLGLNALLATIQPHFRFPSWFVASPSSAPFFSSRHVKFFFFRYEALKGSGPLADRNDGSM
jgi:hypothetical protein